MRRLGERGATAVEFALVAPTLLMFLFLLMEGARLIWSQQVLQEVAFSTARCSALSLSSCSSDTLAKGYAVSRAASSSLTVTAANVTIEGSATCGTIAGMRRVMVTMPWDSAATTYLPAARTRLSVQSCFPVAS